MVFLVSPVRLVCCCFLPCLPHWIKKVSVSHMILLLKNSNQKTAWLVSPIFWCFQKQIPSSNTCQYSYENSWETWHRPFTEIVLLCGYILLVIIYWKVEFCLYHTNEWINFSDTHTTSDINKGNKCTENFRLSYATRCYGLNCVPTPTPHCEVLSP